MNAEYELLQIISRNSAAIIEDGEKYRTSDFCPLAGFKYLLKNLSFYGKISQDEYENEFTADSRASLRASLLKVLGNLERALAVRPEHALAWSAQPLAGLGQSALRAALYVEVTRSALLKALGSPENTLVVESHWMGYRFVPGTTDVAVTVLPRWDGLSQHQRTVRFPFPDTDADTLTGEFERAHAFADDVVKGARELIADDSFWPTLEDVQKYERHDALLIALDALHTIGGWKVDALLKYPDQIENAFKVWREGYEKIKAERAQRTTSGSRPD
jgi:hypothetical protein